MEKVFGWKKAMQLFLEGKSVEARVCIPGLPESENGWFEIKFCGNGGGTYSNDSTLSFGEDWDYRLLDDSKERKELFEECEKLGIINVSRISKVSTSLLKDIVDAVKSVDLNWDEIKRQMERR